MLRASMISVTFACRKGLRTWCMQARHPLDARPQRAHDASVWLFSRSCVMASRDLRDRHELIPSSERENNFGGRGDRRIPGHPVNMVQLSVGRGPSGVGPISLGPDRVLQEVAIRAGLVFFRVPSRAALGYGGGHDSPPVYAVICHRKESHGPVSFSG